MGWLISHNMSKQEQVDELVRTWGTDGRGVRTLAHSVRGNVLFAVHQRFYPDRESTFEDNVIGIYLLRKDRGMGWGYKDMDESMHPYQYNCPLKFLKMAPVACQEWRDKVLAHHEKQKSKAKNKPQIGSKVAMKLGCTVVGRAIGGNKGTIVKKYGQRSWVVELEGSHMPLHTSSRHFTVLE